MARRLLAVGGVTAVVALGTGTMPAAAFNGGPPSACGINWNMTCTGASQAVQNGGDNRFETMAYTCAAVAPVVVSTSVESTGVSCYFLDASNTKYLAFQTDRGSNQTEVWTTGPVSTLTGELTMYARPYQLCVEGGYFANGTFNAIGVPACTQLNF